MNNEQLAKEWMASPHWGGWRVGMVASDGAVFIQHTYGAEHFCERVFAEPWLADPGSGEGAIPDLTHPGTLAFLLEDVRRAHGVMFSLSVEWCEGAVEVRAFCSATETGHLWRRATEAAALMAALRAAPEAK